MPNQGKTYSTAKENEVKHAFEKEGWFAMRSAGSLGLADVIAIKPEKCGHADHFTVRFIQIKTSRNLKKEKKKIAAEEVAFGYINVETWFYPVRKIKAKSLQSST